MLGSTVSEISLDLLEIEIGRMQREETVCVKPGPSLAGIYVLDVPETSPQADLCFCSLDCRNAYPAQMLVEKSPLISAANKLIANAALLGNALRSKDEFMALLQPLLQCVRRKPQLSFSQSMMQGCHRRFVGLLAQGLPGTKAVARRAVRELIVTGLQLAMLVKRSITGWAIFSLMLIQPMS